MATSEKWLVYTKTIPAVEEYELPRHMFSNISNGSFVH